MLVKRKLRTNAYKLLFWRLGREIDGCYGNNGDG